jgi:hypothetical protein
MTFIVTGAAPPVPPAPPSPGGGGVLAGGGTVPVLQDQAHADVLDQAGTTFTP